MKVHQNDRTSDGTIKKDDNEFTGNEGGKKQLDKHSEMDWENALQKTHQTHVAAPFEETKKININKKCERKLQVVKRVKGKIQKSCQLFI